MKRQIAVVACAAACFIATGTLLAFLHSEAPTKVSQRTLTFAQRVAYQRAIEEVYWRHRIWPKENLNSKPSLDAVMSQAQFEKKVEDYLRKSHVLEDYWQRPITAKQLQTEMDRMARDTKQSGVLRKLFEALGNDPFVIAECLARPTLVERDFAITGLRAPSLEDSRAKVQTKSRYVSNAKYTLPAISDVESGCTPDTWTDTNTTNAPAGRFYHTAVWTGSEMILWGGCRNFFGCNHLNTGGKYSPSTDSWVATSTVNAPSARTVQTAVWTGSEMIVWGGEDQNFQELNTGGRYNPSMDSWVATTTTNAPTAREQHTAVWTGSEMIVWGGYGFVYYLNTGGKYNPTTDSWTPTSTTNAPSGRKWPTAVWTDGEMIVWGGIDFSTCCQYFNTGGRYSPSTDSWTATNTTNAPDGRFEHTAVWTGSEMIVWGGIGCAQSCPPDYNTGGRYNPSTDSWVATTTTNAPSAREWHTAIWSGSEMIVWGGAYCDPGCSSYFNTGGRYNPSADSWTATSTTNAPSGRELHTAIWIGSEMIVWGGSDESGGNLNTGGRYCVAVPSPTPTPTASPTSTTTPTATATATATPTGTFTPTPTPTATATATATFTPLPTATATATATPTSTPRPTPTPRAPPTPRPRPTPAPRP